jgi:hypothetical protein
MISAIDIKRSKLSGTSLTAAALLSFIWILLKTPDLLTFLRDGDWCHQLAGADQILIGEHPFIDWRITYGPLVFYASALAQTLTAKRVIGELILVMVGYAAAYGLLFRLAWLASGRRVIAAGVLIVALILLPRLYKYYIVLCPLATLTAAWAYCERPRLRELWLLALSVAVTGLFRPDFGLYTCMAAVAAIVSVQRWRLRSCLKWCAVFGGAVVACASPWLIWAALHRGLDNYLFDTLFGSPTHVSGSALPFPHYSVAEPWGSIGNLTYLLFAFFFSVPIVALIVLVRGRKQIAKDQRHKLIALIVLAQSTLMQSLVRSEYQHLTQAIPASLILIAWMIGLMRSYPLALVRRRALSVAMLITIAGAMGIAVKLAEEISPWPRTNLGMLASDLRDYAGPREAIVARVLQEHPGNWNAQAMAYVTAHTQPGERILALPSLLPFYYFCDRPFGGGQMAVIPGFFSTLEDQRIMVAHLEAKPVRLILDLPDFARDGREDRTMKNFAPIVTGYLDSHFGTVRHFGPAVVKVWRQSQPGAGK